MGYWSTNEEKNWIDRIRPVETAYCGVEPINAKRGLYRLYPRTEGETLNKWVMTGAAVTIDVPLREEYRIRKIGFAHTTSDPAVLSNADLVLTFDIYDNDSAYPWRLWDAGGFAQTGHKKFAEGYEEPSRTLRLTANSTVNDRLYIFVDIMVVSE